MNGPLYELKRIFPDGWGGVIVAVLADSYDPDYLDRLAESLRKQSTDKTISYRVIARY